MVRPILNSWHPGTAKVTFWLPTLFVLFVLASISAAVFVDWKAIIPLLLYVVLIFLDATRKNKNLVIGSMAVVALFVQFFGYGMAFLKSSFYIGLLKKDPRTQFPNLFFE